ncbi:hypothetical protein DPMN_027246 [Dreissena polymorpha]|uniref:Uncharacterized protein n=1 Tax=Dreissena polymorpha TaxID=45954 RepID=A0A9D4LSN7_DREPO|nr:hypothetical protein DPMN_027246 [Dreissena polymorpha]
MSVGPSVCRSVDDPILIFRSLVQSVTASKCHLSVLFLVPVANLSIHLKEDGNQAAFTFINDYQRGMPVEKF